MTFRFAGRTRTVIVPAGGSQTVTFPFDTAGAWELHFSTTQTGSLGDRPISVQTDEPIVRRT